MKKTVLAITMLSLFGCGSEDSTEVVNYHNPIIKIVNKEAYTEITDTTTLKLTYNIVDPDSTVFSVTSAVFDTVLVDGDNDSTLGTISLNQDKKTLSYTPKDFNEDKAVSIKVTVTDDTGLTSSDILNLSIINKIFEAPTPSINLNAVTQINEGDSLTFSYNYDDIDTDLNLINVIPFASYTQENTDHNSDIGSFSVNEDLKKITFTPNSVRGDQIVYIGINAEDDKNLVGSISAALTIIEHLNNKPDINLVFEKSNYNEDEDITFSLTYTDEDINDRLSLTHTLYNENPEDCIDTCLEIESFDISKIGNDYTLKIGDYNFYTPSKKLYIKTEVSDEFDSSINISEFTIDKLEEHVKPTITFKDLNGQIDNIEILETASITFNFSIDSILGELVSYDLTTSPYLNATNFSETDNTVAQNLSDEIVINEAGDITLYTDNINIEGNTTVNFNLSIVNEFGYQNSISIPVSIIENVVREYQTFEEDFNNVIYDYASKKIIEEEQEIFELYLDYLVLKRKISIVNKDTFIAEFNNLRKNENIIIETKITSISDLLEVENVDYPTAYSSYLYLKEKVENYGITLVQEINNKITLDVDNNLPALTEAPILNNSRFIGNLDYGFWIDEEHSQWVFNEKYKILEILQSEITQTCKGI
jgi:hypothetical protein